MYIYIHTWISFTWCPHPRREYQYCTRSPVCVWNITFDAACEGMHDIHDLLLLSTRSCAALCCCTIIQFVQFRKRASTHTCNTSRLYMYRATIHNFTENYWNHIGITGTTCNKYMHVCRPHMRWSRCLQLIHSQPSESATSSISDDMYQQLRVHAPPLFIDDNHRTLPLTGTNVTAHRILTILRYATLIYVLCSGSLLYDSAGWLSITNKHTPPAHHAQSALHSNR